MRVKVTAAGMYTYPDVVVVCEGGQYEDKEVDTLLNPTVIIEVLSKSTATYDRGEKFEQYRKLPSLIDYLLFSQSRCHVEHYARQLDDRWLLTEYNDLDAIVELPSIGCRLALSDVYEQIMFLIKEEGPTWNLSSPQETP
jgi:Uma2 family endonuclease